MIEQSSESDDRICYNYSRTEPLNVEFTERQTSITVPWFKHTEQDKSVRMRRIF